MATAVLALQGAFIEHEHRLAELGEEERQHRQEVMERLSERARRRIEQEVGWTE